MRGFLRLLMALPLLAAPALAKSKCPPKEAGGLSVDWGTDFRDRVRSVFETAKIVAGAGVDPATQLVYVNDLPGKSRTREENGSPAAAVPKDFGNLKNDSVIYTFGLLEIACDEAQLATIFLHELKHLKRNEQGLNHIDRNFRCYRQLQKDNRYPETEAGQRRLDMDFLTKCARVVEEEADAFAFQASPNLPYALREDPPGADPNRDARALVFRNLEKWDRVLGGTGEDPGHGSVGERAEKAEHAALLDSMLRRQKQSSDKMSRMPAEFTGATPASH